MRKSFLLVSLLGICLATPRAARAEEAGNFGLGLMLGAPTGLTAKLYLGGKPFALQFGAGYVEDRFDHSDGNHFHVDVLWHPVILTRTESFTLPFYAGVGGRIAMNDDHCHYANNGNLIGCHDDDTDIGVRVPVGLLMDFTRVPMDLYLEIALVVDVIELDDDNYDDDRDHLNGVIGGRYYF